MGVGLPLGSEIKPGPGIQGGGGAVLTVSLIKQRITFLRLLNYPEGDHACFPLECGHNVRNGLYLRTFRDKSALMMTTSKYNHE